jgi:hypothetical protein
MNLQEALAAIKKLENGADLVSAIESEIDRLNSKSYEVIGEKRTETSKRQSLETALVAIAKAVGLEGDVEAILKEAEGKVVGLATEANQLRTEKATLETRATEAETKVKAAERSGKVAEIAAKVGADAKVLERLLGDKLEEIAIADDGVKVGDKSLQDYVDADESLKPFIPALFPTQAKDQKPPEQKPTPKLPSGAPSGNSDNSKDLVGSYLKRTYTGAKAFAKKSEN